LCEGLPTPHPVATDRSLRHFGETRGRNRAAIGRPAVGGFGGVGDPRRTESRAAVPGNEAPSATTQHTVRGFWFVQVAAPLPHIPRHIVQAERLGP